MILQCFFGTDYAFYYTKLINHTNIISSVHSHYHRSVGLHSFLYIFYCFLLKICLSTAFGKQASLS